MDVNLLPSPANLFVEGETVPFLLQLAQRKGVGGVRVSQRVTRCALAPPGDLFGSAPQYGTNLPRLQAHLSLGMTPAVGNSATHKAVHFSPVLCV